MVDGSGQFWPFEFTMRPGWPTFHNQMATHKGDPAQWMLDACNGEDTLEVSTAIAVGIVVAQPDYPYSHATKRETENVPIYGVTTKNRKHIAPQSVKVTVMPQMDGNTVVDRDMWATAGDYLAVVTGTGRSVKQAAERAYAVVKDIHVPDLMYRDDCHEKTEKDIPELQKHGYATEFQYE
jgi:phosphoribosylamine-glycine ligase